MKTLALFCLTFLLTVAARAEEKKKPQFPKDPAFAFPKQIQLNEKQQAQLDELKKEFAPRVIELNAKLDKILTRSERKPRPTPLKPLAKLASPSQRSWPPWKQRSN